MLSSECAEASVLEILLFMQKQLPCVGLIYLKVSNLKLLPGEAVSILLALYKIAEASDFLSNFDKEIYKLFMAYSQLSNGMTIMHVEI